MRFLSLRTLRSTYGMITSSSKTRASLYCTSKSSPPPDFPPDAPTTCCMSGCANCVWLDYAEEVSKYYELKGSNMSKEEIIKDIERQLSDPMLKAFILLELKMKLK